MVIFDPFLEILGFIVDIYFKIVVVQVVLFWLIHFKVLEPSNKYAQKTVELLDKATVPVYNKIKSKIPTVVSGIDFAPFGVLLVLYFISRLILSLNKAGLIISLRGAKGGLQLAKPPKEITLLDIIEAMEGPVSIVECVADKTFCKKSADCSACRVWSSLNKKIKKQMQEITLKDLLKSEKNRIGRLSV